MSKPQRVEFLDLARTISILLMLQGHFVSLWLDESITSTNNTPFYIYENIRGLTAPLFLTITGIVFTFLLFRGNLNNFNTERFNRGRKRLIMLLVWAYVLQLNFRVIFNYLASKKFEGSIFEIISSLLGDRFFTFQILQSIAFGILFILIIYYLFSKLHTFKSIGIGFLVIAFIFFAGHPFLRGYFSSHDQIPFLPKGISTIFGGENSVFPIFPSGAYVLGGAFIGYKLAQNEALFSARSSRLQLLFIGLLLIALGFVIPKYLNVYLGPMMGNVKYFTSTIIFFHRFGQVILVILLIAWLSSLVKRINPFILKIGQNTLSIYLLHSIILYGCISGFGLDTISVYINKTPDLIYLKSPLFTVIFVVLFLSIFILQIAYFEKLNNLFYRICNLLTQFKMSTAKPSLSQQIISTIFLELLFFLSLYWVF